MVCSSSEAGRKLQALRKHINKKLNKKLNKKPQKVKESVKALAKKGYKIPGYSKKGKKIKQWDKTPALDQLPWMKNFTKT